VRSINARTLEVNNLLLGYTAYVGVLTNRKKLRVRYYCSRCKESLARENKFKYHHDSIR